MLKKILIAVVILGIAAVAFIGFGSYAVVKDVIKDKEPQIRQYIQLDEAAQNKYVIDNISDLFAEIDLDKDGEPEEKEKIERLMKVNDNPEVQPALIKVGRSFMASAIMMSDSIVKDLPADAKAKYQQESDKLKANIDAYSDIVEKVDPTLKIKK